MAGIAGQVALGVQPGLKAAHPGQPAVADGPGDGMVGGPARGQTLVGDLPGCDAVIHLNGEKLEVAGQIFEIEVSEEFGEGARRMFCCVEDRAALVVPACREAVTAQAREIGIVGNAPQPHGRRIQANMP